MEVASGDSSSWASDHAKRRRRGVLAGTLAFLFCIGLGLTLTVLVIDTISPKVPNPTEAYEGFGETMMAVFYLAVGAAISLLISTSVAAAIAMRVRRWK